MSHESCFLIGLRHAKTFTNKTLDVRISCFELYLNIKTLKIPQKNLEAIISLETLLSTLYWFQFLIFLLLKNIPAQIRARNLEHSVPVQIVGHSCWNADA